MPTTQFLDVAGKKTQLIVHGDGPPLVYLHSAAGEAEWGTFHERLSRKFRLYVPAHPGFSLSAGLEQIRDMDDLAWHYVDLFDQLQLANVPIVGMSLGGWLACELLLRRPQLASKLVLSAAAGLHVPGAPIAELFVDGFDRLRPLLFLNPRSPAADELLPASQDDPRVLLWLRAREATARVGWNPYLHNPRLLQHLRRIPCPTLVLWGEQDAVIPRAHGECYAKHLPNARLEVIPQCGHMLQYEKTDEWQRAIERFVLGT
jgi:pimeloyl-ACP methyl ester carboxylesterase